jgi:hypothetical protein
MIEKSGQPAGRPRPVRAVVKLADSALASAKGPARLLQDMLAEFGGTLVRGPNRHGRAVVAIARETDASAFLAKLNSRDDVAYAELDGVDRAAGEPERG